MTRMRPIVLLTDFGTKDSYVASMKGVILSIFPEALLVDLSHEVAPQNIAQAALLLEWTYSYFPPNTLFVSVVDPGVGSERRILAAKTKKGIFLAPDNGLLSRVLKREKAIELRHVTNSKFFLPKVSFTFHGRDCFAPTGARLARNPKDFSKLGPKTKEFTPLKILEPKLRGSRIEGEILFFDHFGNAFVNIPKSLVQSHRDSASARVLVKGKSLGRIRRSYFEVEKGKAVPVFSSVDLLEIAVNHGSARERLKLNEGDRVEITG